MERLDGKTFIFHKEYFYRLGLALMMAFAVVACGNDDGGGHVLPPPVYITPGISPNCVNCAEVNSAPMAVTTFTALNVRNTVSLRNIQVYGNGVRYTSTSTPYNLPANKYQGQISASGEFVVNTAVVDRSGRCQLIPGSYFADTLQAGFMGSPALGNLELPDMIVQPGNIRIAITQGIMYSGGTRLMGILKIVSVNGLACDPLFVDDLY